MKNYQTIVVFAPMSDIRWDDWQKKINRKHFNCGPIKVLEELKQICPNIQTTTIENLCDKFNRNRTLEFCYMKHNWFGVIYVEI